MNTEDTDQQVPACSGRRDEEKVESNSDTFVLLCRHCSSNGQRLQLDLLTRSQEREEC